MTEEESIREHLKRIWSLLDLDAGAVYFDRRRILSKELVDALWKEEARLREKSQA